MPSTKKTKPHGATIGQRVRSAREAAGLSQRALAAAASMTQANLCAIERDERDLLTATLGNLAKALRVHPRDLLP